MAFTSADEVELRMLNGTMVARCRWQDRTAEAAVAGENLLYRVVEAPYSDPRLEPTGELSAHNVGVYCPRPMGSGELRFEVVISPDLLTATRLQTIDDIGTQTLGSSLGGYDVGRTMTLASD